MRPGSAAARRLFKRRTAEPFHNALAQYPAVVGRIQSRGTPRLKTLRGDDAWVLEELPALLAYIALHRKLLSSSPPLCGW